MQEVVLVHTLRRFSRLQLIHILLEVAGLLVLQILVVTQVEMEETLQSL